MAYNNECVSPGQRRGERNCIEVCPALEATQGQILSQISHRYYLFEVAFVWELTKETIVLPLGVLQGGGGWRNSWLPGTGKPLPEAKSPRSKSMMTAPRLWAGHRPGRARLGMGVGAIGAFAPKSGSDSSEEYRFD